MNYDTDHLSDPPLFHPAYHHQARLLLELLKPLGHKSLPFHVREEREGETKYDGKGDGREKEKRRESGPDSLLRGLLLHSAIKLMLRLGAKSLWAKGIILGLER